MTQRHLHVEPATASSLGQGVLRFLGSLGQRSEAELYLRLFHTLPPGRFALIVPDAEVLGSRAGTLAEQLAFLRELGLHPSLLLPSVSEELLAQFCAALLEVDLRGELIPISTGTLSSLSQLKPQTDPGWVRIFQMESGSDDLLAEAVGEISPRRTVFLRRAGGLGPHRNRGLQLAPGHVLQSNDSGIFVINLRNDAANLYASKCLNAEDRSYLARAEKILAGPAGRQSRATVSVSSPLSILRELFTVSGEGTLIKPGSEIRRYESYDSLEAGRLKALIEKSFSRKLHDEFFSRPLLSAYLESDYRGVAVLEAGRHAAFLSKFAVLPVAQGEGLGQDLFWAFTKDIPQVYWRARLENPINTWYRGVCDGMQRAGDWVVYFRGVSPQDVPSLIEDALSRPVDLDEIQQ